MKSILIGYGYWGRILERYIRQSPAFELIGIYSPHYEESVQWDWVLESGKVECAFVCAPIEQHYELTRQLLGHGIHVFCEKPLCKTYLQTEELFALAEKNNVCLFTDYIYMVSRTLRKLKSHLNEFGKIQYIDLTISQYGNFYEKDHVFEVIGVHMITALAFLLETETGDIKVNRIDIKKERHPGLPEAGIVLWNTKDVRGKIECSLWSTKKCRRIEVLCENGVLVFDMMDTNTLQIYDADNTLIIAEQIDEGNNLALVLDQFAETIQNNDGQNKKISLQAAEILEQIGGHLE